MAARGAWRKVFVVRKSGKLGPDGRSLTCYGNQTEMAHVSFDRNRWLVERTGIVVRTLRP